MKNNFSRFYSLFLGLALVTVSLLGTSCSSNNWYVSSQGNDTNKGNSENKPFKTLAKALSTASAVKGECTITVIGTLNAESEGSNDGAVFRIGQTGEAVITITGMENATGNKQAVLSGSGKTLPVLKIDGNTGIRLENMEISGASDNDGVIISGSSTVTLGKGVKIANNSGAGITVTDKSKLIMEGGEISGNKNRGVFISKECSFTMTDGEICRNENKNEWRGGGGVLVEGTFVMEGGQISENQANSPGRGGGVFVSQAIFTLKGGKIINNRSVGYTRRGYVGNGGAGGIYVYGDTDGRTTFTMEGGEISGNTAERFGGGILLGSDQGEKGTFTMTGGTITGNTARGAGGIQNYGNRYTVKLNGGSVTGNTPNDVDNGWSW